MVSQVVLQQGSGYKLKEIFAPQSYDIVTANQALEHIARLPLFMNQVAAVLRSNGQAYFTVDSAHWRSRFDPREPVRLLKNLVKKGLSLTRYERHYDLPWEDTEVEAACRQGGLKVVECGYYNLAPLKFIHNHIIPSGQKKRIYAAME